MHRDTCDESISSPLTSLSSLDDESDLSDQNFHDTLYSIEDIEAAQVLFPPQSGDISIEGAPQVLSAFQLRNLGTPAISEHVIQLHYDLEPDPSLQLVSAPAVTRSDPTTNGSRPSKRKVCTSVRCRGRVCLLMTPIPG